MTAPRLLLVSSFLLVACASGPSTSPRADAPPTAAPSEVPLGAPVSYAWSDLRGRPISSGAMAGRITVIGFITTYDVMSQAQVRFLDRLQREHVPRLNVAVLVLEQPENRPMVEAFASALELSFPVAMADAATIRGEGPFRGLHHVPAITILDREGRERLRHIGPLDRAGLEDAVLKVETEAGVGRKASP